MKRDDAPVSQESLYHFRCRQCSGWWSLATSQLTCDGHDALKAKLKGFMSGYATTWYCPWCGTGQVFRGQTTSTISTDT